VIVNKIGQNINIVTGQTISPQAMRAIRLGGDTSLTDYYGYQKVKYSNGTPVTTAEGDYVYKLVNLLGDGNLVSEYYLDGRFSVLNNGTVKIQDEIPDSVIIDYFGGEVTEEIVSLPTEEIVDEEVEYTEEEQLQFEINDLTQRIAELEYIQKDLDVTNTETIVLNNLPKITPISATKETGAKVGTKLDISPSLLSGNGKTVDQAANDIWDDNFRDTGIDTQDVRNIIIDILSSGSKANYKSQIGTSSEVSQLKDQLRDLKDKLPKEKVTKAKTIKSVPEQLSLFNLMFGDTITLKDGKEYNKSDINSNMLEALGYNPKEIGKILKSIC
jgi:ribosomal protein S19